MAINSNKRHLYDSMWNKYMPIIRILLKRSNEQVLALNRIDFERTGSFPKSGYKFTINYVNGRSDSLFTSNELAHSFTTILQEDEMIKKQLLTCDYTFTLTTKFQLIINATRLKEEALPA